MPTNFNPFAQWLEFNPKITNPHHFQLLGVSPKTDDQIEIQKAVEAGVKRNLALLAKVPAGEHDELVQKLKTRLSIAQKTLLDPKARNEYLDKLKRQIKEQSSGKLTPTPSAPVASPAGKPKSPNPDFAASRTSKEQDATTPEAPADFAPPIIGRKSSAKSAFTPPTIGVQPRTTPKVPAAKAVLPGSQPIPMAIPLTSASTTAVPSSGEEVVTGVAVNSDGVAIDDVKIQKNKAKRRKKSNIGLIIGALMVLSAGVGGFLIYKNIDVLLNLAGVELDEVPAAPGIIKKNNEPPIKNDAPPSIPAAKDKDPAPDPTARKLPSLDIDALPELDISEIIKDPETAMVTGRDADDQQRLEERNLERLKAMGFDDAAKPENTSSEASEGTNMRAVSDEDANHPPSGEIVSFDELQLARYRRHLERARRSLFRRDKGTALKSIELATAILDDVRPDRAARFDAEQAPMAALAAEYKEIYGLIDGFWEQVVASCQNIPGGQEIVATGQTIGFIEADEQKVIVQHAGSNVTYEYYFCPPSLAVELALQGAIPDIPTWNKQLAAFYALNQVNGSTNYRTKINDLLAISEEAGHQCDGIRHFALFEFGTVGKPAEKIKMPNKKAFTQGISEFRSENDYDEIEKLTPGMAAMLAELLLQIDSPNFEQHVVLLEEARRLGIHSGDAAVAEDAIIELDNFAKIDRSNLTCSTFSELAKRELTPSQRRSLMEQAIPFLKSELAETAKSKSRQLLTEQLTDIATAYAMTDAARRINQLGNEK